MTLLAAAVNDAARKGKKKERSGLIYQVETHIRIILRQSPRDVLERLCIQMAAENTIVIYSWLSLPRL